MKDPNKPTDKQLIGRLSAALFCLSFVALVTGTWMMHPAAGVVTLAGASFFTAMLLGHVASTIEEDKQ